MRLLFVMPGVPLAFDHSGAASRYAQNFLALKNLGVELYVLRFHLETQKQAVLDFEKTSETAQIALEYSSSWREVVVPTNQPQGKWDVLHRVIFNPIRYEFPFYKPLAEQLALSIHETAPDLIWAEHSDAAAAVWHLSPSQPWIFSHHDMRYLIRAIRDQKTRISHAVLAQVSRKAEIKVSKSASLVITGSQTEAGKLRKIGCRNVHVIPMANANLPEINLQSSPSKKANIIHLGSLETTANRSGLSAYLSKAHSKTLKLCAENQVSTKLVIVGDASRVKSPLKELLLQKNITLTGFVPEITSVLRPYDIAILPYTQDSGYRTKLPLLMGYAQVVIATRTAVAGSLLPGLEDVCTLLDKVEDFPEKIAWLSAHPEERRRLGQAARAYAKEYLSLGAIQPYYADLLHQAIKKNQ